MRRKSNTINVGGVAIGGSADISIQSMTNTDTRDVEATVNQIALLHDAGCDIVRVAVPDMQAADAIAEIKKRSPLPVVADIHFDYRTALRAVESGVDKIRINPGNIGDASRVKAVADACRERGIPIRVGVNAGSVEKRLLEKYGAATPDAMADSAMYHAKLLEDCGFGDICLSAKASDVASTVEVYRLLAQRCEYPLHLGITHAGTKRIGTIKNAAGIGGLLALGIGDTLRVSLTDTPVEEVYAARDILKALNLRKGIEFISCPTCGRCGIDIISIARDVENRLNGVKADITVAVMGCAVNGLGEAKCADIGIAGGNGCALLFRNGEIVRKIKEEEAADVLCAEVMKMAASAEK